LLYLFSFVILFKIKHHQMKIFKIIVHLLLIQELIMSKPISIPIAKKIPFEHKYPDCTIEDSYHWLRQKDWTQEKGVTDPDILNYLKEENNYTEDFFKKNQSTVDHFLTELKELIDIDDETYPVSKGVYAYFIKTQKGKNYHQHFRKNKKTGAIELVFDENLEAQKGTFFRLGYLKPSPDHKLIALAFDTDGSERYKLHILNTETKNYLDFSLSNVSSNGLVWAKDQSGFYFQKVDDQWRSNTVYYYDIKKNEEKLVFEEKDSTNHVNIYRTTDHSTLCIDVRKATDNVVYVHDLANKDFLDIQKPFERKKDILFSLNSQENDWIIITNDKGPKKRILRVQKGNEANPKVVFDDTHYPDIYLTGFSVFKNALFILGKKNGIPVLFLEKNGTISEISFTQSSFTLDFCGNDYEDDYCHVAISSLVQPSTDIFVDIETQDQKIMKTREIPHYNPDNYLTDRLYATSEDGEKIPYTIAYKKGTALGNAPVYLYGYGSYGYALDPDFRASFLPLMNKGYIVVMAHIRGGGDLGRHWYEAAKFKTKKKTFEDFIAIAKDMIEKKYTQKGNIRICGGSAGGMLMGAVLNMEPSLFHSAIAMVPFVDVLNTMMDETLPLTPGEFTEWGNPKNKDFFDYIKSYSPYDNLEAKEYPPVYVTAGINDPRVTYWEPAKWVAKLRSLKTDNNILLLETEMGAGHGGPSGKLNNLLEIAKRYTFMEKSRG
jgi:oligopeptidase B